MTYKMGNSEAWLVNEAGLYSLILTSRKPQAKAFKRWVTHEVLPAIRKDGGYLLGEAKVRTGNCPKPEPVHKRVCPGIGHAEQFPLQRRVIHQQVLAGIRRRRSGTRGGCAGRDGGHAASSSSSAILGHSVPKARVMMSSTSTVRSSP
jgi:BRO family, N-terminal domain